jgi:capsular exopolysaccharide synthesis family protein
MALQVYLRAIVSGWWIILITLIVGLGLATAYNSISKPVYSSSVKFFVSTQSEEGETPLQADEFAQRRINSYVQLMTSETMINTVKQSSGVDLSIPQLTSMISAYSDPETVLLGVEVRDTDKDRSFAIAKAVAEDFGALVAELDNRGNADASNVKLNVVSGPTLNAAPISPRTTLNLALGGIVGLALGLAIAILRKTAKKTVGTDSELGEVLGLPSVGFIPRLRLSHRDEARSALTIATERLVTNLALDTLPAPETRVIQVTSASRGDGRTLVASSLASTLAGLDRRVVLVEADLRTPSLERAFQTAGEPGLADVLGGQALASEVIQETSIPLLSLITAGTDRGKPSELLTSRRFAELIDELSSDFDAVVIDTPPLLPQIDSAVIAKKAHGVVLVVSRDRTTKQQLRDAAAALAPRSSRVLGTVLNAAPAPRNAFARFVTQRRIDPFAALGLLLPAPREAAGAEDTPSARASNDDTGAGRDPRTKVPVSKP